MNSPGAIVEVCGEMRQLASSQVVPRGSATIVSVPETARIDEFLYKVATGWSQLSLDIELVDSRAKVHPASDSSLIGTV